MLGSLDHVTRQLIVHTSPTKRSSDFIAHLEQLDRLYGPKPGSPSSRSCWSRTMGRSTPASSRSRRWPPARTGSPSSGCPNTRPELNDIELVWRDLKAHHLAHQTFTDADALDQAIHEAVDALNAERIRASVGQATNLCLAWIDLVACVKALARDL